MSDKPETLHVFSLCGQSTPAGTTWSVACSCGWKGSGWWSIGERDDAIAAHVAPLDIDKARELTKLDAYDKPDSLDLALATTLAKALDELERWKARAEATERAVTIAKDALRNASDNWSRIETALGIESADSTSDVASAVEKIISAIDAARKEAGL